ncbi:MAG: DUF4124 domain-containing protein [Steroidobacteraceae bacterium]|jgi:hypothetical protein
MIISAAHRQRNHDASTAGLWLRVAAVGLLASAAMPLARAAQNGTSGGSAAPVFRWVDDKGVVHYGDSVPTEYSQNERSVLNGQGVEVGHVEGGKSPAEQAARAQADEIARQHAQHDQFLLATYVSTRDIEQLRDERLAQMDAQIRAATSYIDNLGGRLSALAERAMLFKPYSSEPSARRMPDDLAEDLVHTANDVRNQRLALEAKRREQLDTRAQFEGDIQRYRELTTRPRS